MFMTKQKLGHQRIVVITFIHEPRHEEMCLRESPTRQDFDLLSYRDQLES